MHGRSAMILVKFCPGKFIGATAAYVDDFGNLQFGQFAGMIISRVGKDVILLLANGSIIRTENIFCYSLGT